SPAAYEALRRPKERGVEPMPEELIARLRPLERHEFRTIDPFRAALAEVLEPEELHAYRAQLAEAARDKPKSATLDDVNGPLGFGGIVVVGGLTATLAGGYLADWLRTRLRGAYFAVSGAGMLVGL